MGEAAAIGGVSSLLGGYMSMQGQQQTNAANEQIAGEQMAFQERMSDTAYQRQVADMKAAGLNPMFAVNSGGASSPPGASIAMSNPMQGMGAGISQAGQVPMQLKQADADVTLKMAQAAGALQQAKTGQSQAASYDESVRLQKLEENAAATKSRIYGAINSGIDNMKSNYDRVNKLMEQPWKSNAGPGDWLPTPKFP